MIELFDTFPTVDVLPAEYYRLLGYPAGAELTDRAEELTAWARDWYARHGRPWVYLRQVNRLEVQEETVCIDGAAFASKRLRATLIGAGAHSAILVAVGAGPELEAETQRLWQAEKPDEYYFLEVFGSAVVEHLITMTGARLCAWADSQSLAVLPHYSPGYPEWDISQQPRLLALIRRPHRHPLPFPVEAMESGMLRPKKSLLAVFGLTRHTERVQRLTTLVPCQSCSYTACQFRRAPYARAGAAPQKELPMAVAAEEGEREEPSIADSPLTRNARYTVSTRALRRWAAERLSLDFHDDGTIDACFRYEGTTCSNMGRTLLFDYRVTLGPRQEGYPLLAQSCAPAPGDEGYMSMCRYRINARPLMTAIDQEKPLLGARLDDVLSWERGSASAGCYCEPTSRTHKWGLVLETLHFALAQREEPTL